MINIDSFLPSYFVPYVNHGFPQFFFSLNSFLNQLNFCLFFFLFCSSFSVGSVIAKSLSRVRLFVTPWTVAYQASPSMEFSRQEYRNGLSFPSPGDLPDPLVKLCFLHW